MVLPENINGIVKFDKYAKALIKNEVFNDATKLKVCGT